MSFARTAGMRSLALITLFVGMLSLFPSGNILAQASGKDIPLTRILFVFDCSLSMIGKWESGTKMEVSKNILTAAIDSLAKIPNVEAALRMYGHEYPVQPQRNCRDTKLEVPFSKNNFTALKNRIRAAQPKGTTPIAYSLEQCGKDFPVDATARNIIILITDGEEECDGDPCAVSAALQSKGIALRPFVLGVGLDENFKKTFECVGKYFDASNEKNFKTALGVIISQAMNSTTMQVNLLDQSGKPSETNLNMTFYDQQTGSMRYNLVHTINNAGYPDTLAVDPLPTYRIVAHSVPAVEKKDVEIIPGKHNIVGIPVPQGYLTLKSSAREHQNLPYIIRLKGETTTLLHSKADKPEHLLVGKYDLEVLSLPHTLITDVEVSQSKTTTVQIMPPGMANILFAGPGPAQLFLKEKNGLRWVYNFPDNPSRETLILQPGEYLVVYRSKAAKESLYTIERSFILNPGGTVTVKMQ